MSYISIVPSSAVVRWYDKENGMQDKLPFKAVASLAYISDNVVYVYAMHGTISKNDVRALFEQLKLQGVKHVIAERNKKVIVYSLTEDEKIKVEKRNLEELKTL